MRDYDGDPIAITTLFWRSGSHQSHSANSHHGRPASGDGPRRHAADGVRGGRLGFDDLLRAGIPVTLGGTLELTFADDVNLASQLGRTFDLFDWTGVNPTGAFAVSSPYAWDLSNLYTTGEVTLTAIPEPATLVLLMFAAIGWRALRGRSMSRRTRGQWFSGQAFRNRRSIAPRRAAVPYSRRLRIEPLEDRRLLAVVTVNTLGDTVDFNDGVTSLREAIFATNLVAGADTIEFAASLTSGGPATILLTQGELAITDALTINGPARTCSRSTPAATTRRRTMNNGDGSRVFNIDDGNDANLLDVSISGLTLTGGDVNGDGGAIFTRENLSVTASTISGNSAGGGGGGGIYAYGNVTVTSSTISGNSAMTVTLQHDLGNSAGRGGGILLTAM